MTQNEPRALEFVLPTPAQPSLSEAGRLLQRPSGARDRVAGPPFADTTVEREPEARLLLLSNDPVRRIAACYRLAEKGRKGSETISALAGLIRRDPHPLVKAHALHALVRLGSVVATRTLRYEVERLNIFAQPPGVQLEAVKAEVYLSNHRGKADEGFLMAVFDHWRVQPADADSDLMLWAILFAHFLCSWSLQRCSARYPDYIPAVLELVRGGRNRYTRAAALAVLGTPVVTAENAAACNEALRGGLADPEEAVRLAALAALGGEATGHPGIYVPDAIEQLVAVMADPRETEAARRRSARAVAFQGGQEAGNAARLLAALDAVAERDDLFRDLLKGLISAVVEGVAAKGRRSDPDARRWREIVERLASLQP